MEGQRQREEEGQQVQKDLVSCSKESSRLYPIVHGELLQGFMQSDEMTVFCLSPRISASLSSVAPLTLQ